VAEEKLDLLQLAASGTTESSATPREIMRREFVYSNFAATSLTTCQTSFSVTPSPQTSPALLSLAMQVNDCPMTFTLLDLIDRQTGEFVTPKPASQEDGK
jgi:hypothetical protein